MTTPRRRPEQDTFANPDDQKEFEELAKSLREIEDYLVEQLREVEAQEAGFDTRDRVRPLANRRRRRGPDSRRTKA